ncbi:MAG: ATP-dependent DNA helicase [Actinomycetota bacterium]
MSIDPRRATEAVVRALGGHEPTDEQRAAIQAPLRHGVINAGAGSGKTAVMTARVVHLIASGQVEPTQILGLTFTNKATEELGDRVRAAMALLELAPGDAPTIQTYNGFASSLVADHAMKLGLEPDARLLTAGQASQLLWEVIGSMRFEANEVRSQHLVSQAAALISTMADHEVTPQQLVDHERAMLARFEGRRTNAKEKGYIEAMHKRIEFAEVARRFDEIKRARGVMDFADQITLAVKVAAHPEVQRWFRERFRVLLLDEYQDTNIAQARLIQTLALGEGGPAVTAVGDPAQNIYSWRGASLRNIIRFPEDFADENGPATSFSLRTNFRCSGQIIATANHVLKDLSDGGNAGSLTARAGAPAGQVDTAVLADQIDEARFIAGQVEAELAAGTPRNQIAILGRKRRVVGPIQEALLQRDIPVEVVELGGLLDTPEVVDVLAYLRAIENPGDNIAFARILSGPRWRIGYRDMALLARATLAANRVLRDEDRHDEQVPYEIGTSLTDLEKVEGLSDQARERLNEFRELHSELASLAADPVELMEAVIERSGLRLELAVADNARARSVRRNLSNLLEHASGFRSVDGQDNLRGFLDWLDAVEASSESLSLAQPSDDDSVKILTLHGAKGLEFEVVILAGVSAGKNSKIFPDTDGQPNPTRNPSYMPFELRGDSEDMPTYDGNFAAFEAEITARALREEKRLLYVAITRAKRRLIVTAAHWYLPAGFKESMKNPMGPSAFMRLVREVEGVGVLADEEQPEQNTLVEHRAELSAGWPPTPRRIQNERFPQGVAEAVAQARLGSEPLTAAVPEQARPVPKALSVTALVTHAACPLRFHWSFVRPLPRRPSPAARVGTIVHDWIAERHEPQLRLLDPEEFAPSKPEGRVATLRERFASTRFGDSPPTYIEHPFAMSVGGRIIQGRIDAVYVAKDGSSEIIDWKTGSAPAQMGAERWQMELYALALQRILGLDPAKMTATFVYLGDDPVIERSVEVRPADQIEADLLERLALIEAGGKEPTPGPGCGHCDFLVVCAQGRAWSDNLADHA